MTKLFKNLRSGAWRMVCSPGFRMVAALGIALSVGTHPARFQLFRDSPHPAIVREEGKTSHPNHVFGDLAGVADSMSLQLTAEGDPEELRAGVVPAGFFQRIGVHPIVGRAFTPDDNRPGNDHVVILSHRLWSRRFGRDAGIIGKTIALNGENRQVVGILPPDFAWNNRRPDVWVPSRTGPHGHYLTSSGLYQPPAKLALSYE